MPATKKQLLNSLTSLRFVAAMLVFSWHAHISDKRFGKFELGYAGVSFFFVLSGFVLTYAYYDRIQRGSRGAIKSYYIARIAKIYPVHLLTFLLALPLAVVPMVQTRGWLDLLKQSTANLALVHSFIPDYRYSFNSLSWSISDELFFYALMPAIMVGLYRLRHRLRAWMVGLAMVGIWTTLFLFLRHQPATVDEWRFYIFPLVRLPDFVLGSLLCLLYWKARTRFNVQAMHRAWFSLLEVLALLLAFIVIHHGPRLPQSLHFDVRFLPAWIVVIFIFSFERGWLSKILGWRPLVFLGEISFSFYMLHQLIIRYLHLNHVPHLAPIAFVISLASSAALFLCYEEPLRKRFRNWLDRVLVLPRRFRKDSRLGEEAL